MATARKTPSRITRSSSRRSKRDSRRRSPAREPISMEEELVLAFPAAGEETDPTLAQTDTDGHLWSRSREFDWGD